jgi:hypothetical protein
VSREQPPVSRTGGERKSIRAHLAREEGVLPEAATWGLGEQS